MIFQVLLYGPYLAPTRTGFFRFANCGDAEAHPANVSQTMCCYMYRKTPELEDSTWHGGCHKIFHTCQFAH